MERPAILESKMTSTIQQVLKTIFLSHTVLFLGCGQTVNDPNIGAFLDWIGDFTSESVHHHFKLDVGNVGEVLDYSTENRLYSLGYGLSYDNQPAFLKFILRKAGFRGNASRISNVPIRVPQIFWDAMPSLPRLILRKLVPQGISASSPCTDFKVEGNPR